MLDPAGTLAKTRLTYKMAQRGKGRGSNLMGNQDFIALGPKTGSSSVSKPASSASASSSGQGGSGSIMQKSKSGSRAGAPSSSAASSSSSWESVASTSVDASDLVSVLTEKDVSGERAAAILCGAVKILRSQRSKPDQLLYLSLLFLAKTEPHLFLMQEHVIEAFCSLLRRDPKESYKSKGNVLVSVLAANVLAAAYREERNWPECFVRVYVDDAMGERLWVDHPDCKGFVDNVVTAFGTKIPSAAASQGLYAKPGGDSATGRESPGPSSGSATPTRIAADDEDSSSSGVLALAAMPANLETDVPVQPRYQGLRNVVEHLVMEVVREQLSRRQGTDNITRNFLRFLTSACGLPEVRLTVISKIEMWVMNPKVSRVAHELLLSMSINCNTYTPMDAEVLNNFSRLRFKNKPNLNLYIQCVREIATAHPENLPAIVKNIIFNELSNARNTTNMTVLATLFNVDGDRAASSLASVFIELLLQKDDYLRALRALLREIVRALRGDVNLKVFSAQLMREKPKEQVRIRVIWGKQYILFIHT